MDKISFYTVPCRSFNPNSTYQKMIRFFDKKSGLFLPNDWVFYKEAEPLRMLTSPSIDWLETPKFALLPDKSLREEQTLILDRCKERVQKHRYPSGIINMKTGRGKCWGKDTGIVMYDGSVKKVQDIQDGDQLIGIDSTPRNVISTTQGVGTMYRITTTKKDTFTCNGDHILVLKCSYNYKGLGSIWKKGQIVTMSVLEYLELLKKYKKTAHLFKLFKSEPLEFHSDIIFDPYLFGVWLGDGSSDSFMITNPDKEIEEYIISTGRQYKKSKYGEKCVGYRLYDLMPFLRKNNLYKNKHIPDSFKMASLENRLLLLAGLIDTDGYKDPDSCRFIFSNTNESIINDIVWIARSAGFLANKSKTLHKVSQNGKGKPSWNVSISGDIERIPIRIKRKQAGKRLQIKDWKNFGFTIENIGQGDYYGFTLDGDRKCILDNFIVTHNTLVMSELAVRLPGKVLILCHNEANCRSTQTHFKNFYGIPKDDIGMVFGGQNTITDITVATHKTFGMHPEYFKAFEIILYDEMHKNISDITIKALCRLVNCKALYGFSATPYRDDLHKADLEKMFGREIVVSKYSTPEERYNILPTLYTENYDTPKYDYIDYHELRACAMNDTVRTKKQLEIIVKYLEKFKRQCSLVFTDRVEEAETYKNLLSKNPSLSVVLMHGGMDTAQSLQDLSDARLTGKPVVLVGTIQKIGTGIDFPFIDAVFFFSPTKFNGTVVQGIGRGLRLHEGKKDVILVDWHDNDRAILHRQHLERVKVCKREYGVVSNPSPF